MSKAAEIADGRTKKRPGLEEQKRIIADAAVELFIEHGSRAISISQICDRASVSRPTFYRCFKDKDELIYNLYQDSVNTNVQDIMLNGLNSSTSLDEAWLRNALDELFESIFQRPKLAELVFIESNDSGSPAFTIVDMAFEHAADVMENYMVKSTGKKPSRVLLKSVLAANQWIAHDAIRKGLSDNVKQEAKDASWDLIRSLVKIKP